jgi:hypothetical protein
MTNVIANGTEKANILYTSCKMPNKVHAYPMGKESKVMR